MKVNTKLRTLTKSMLLMHKYSTGNTRRDIKYGSTLFIILKNQQKQNKTFFVKSSNKKHT
jgi:hypothetical protein